MNGVSFLGLARSQRAMFRSSHVGTPFSLSSPAIAGPKRASYSLANTGEPPGMPMPTQELT